MLDKEVDGVLGALMPSNALVMQVSLHTGLRVSDVLSLKTDQLKPRFWVKESKTGKSKQVGLPAPLLAAIREQAGDVWAFPGRVEGAHRTRQAVWKDVKRAARAFRIPRNIAPHSFRKCYAVDVLDQYGDVETVQKALNHRSIEVTYIYVMAALSLRAKQGLPAAHFRRRLS